MIVSCTGHRPLKIGGYQIPNPIYNYICEETKKILNELKPEKAITGMALGYDQYFAEICIELGIPFIAAIPFVGQEKKWPQKSQEKYNEILNEAEEKVIVCPGSYAAWKMQKRNEWMCDRADIVIACWDKSAGGTANCVYYAQSKNKEIKFITPKV